MKTIKTNFFLQFLLNPRYRLYRHLILILFLSSVLYNGRTMSVEPAATYTKIASLIMLLSLFYVNMYQLVPKLLFRNRYAGYGLSVSGLIAIALFFLIGGRYFLKPYFKPVYDRGSRRS
ncbi:MAG: hypothetical protein WDO19_06920 [Bacteroidota bacterium]